MTHEEAITRKRENQPTLESSLRAAVVPAVLATVLVVSARLFYYRLLLLEQLARIELDGWGCSPEAGPCRTHYDNYPMHIAVLGAAVPLVAALAIHASRTPRGENASPRDTNTTDATRSLSSLTIATSALALAVAYGIWIRDVYDQRTALRTSGFNKASFILSVSFESTLSWLHYGCAALALWSISSAACWAFTLHNTQSIRVVHPGTQFPPIRSWRGNASGVALRLLLSSCGTFVVLALLPSAILVATYLAVDCSNLTFCVNNLQNGRRGVELAISTFTAGSLISAVLLWLSVISSASTSNALGTLELYKRNLEALAIAIAGLAGAVVTIWITQPLAEADSHPIPSLPSGSRPPLSHECGSEQVSKGLLLTFTPAFVLNGRAAADEDSLMRLLRTGNAFPSSPDSTPPAATTLTVVPAKDVTLPSFLAGLTAARKVGYSQVCISETTTFHTQSPFFGRLVRWSADVRPVRLEFQPHECARGATLPVIDSRSYDSLDQLRATLHHAEPNGQVPCLLLWDTAP